MTRQPQRRSVYRGEEGRRKAEEVIAENRAKAEARKNRSNDPFRFSVKEGDTGSFIVVDDEPAFYRYEHNLEDHATGRWNIFTGCINEWDNCPICTGTKSVPYYALYLTVIDFTPFTTQDGTKVEFSKKLLVVKPAQQKKFHRAFAKAQQDGRTMRGMYFETTRDGPKDPRIGNDIEFIEYVEDDELSTYVREWTDKDGKVHVEDCSEPYDYDELFEEPTADSLREVIGGDPTPGSSQHIRRELGGRGPARPSRNTEPTRPRRGPAPRSGGDDDEDDDGDWKKPERTERMPSRGVRDKSAQDEETPTTRGVALRGGSGRPSRTTESGPLSATTRRRVFGGRTTEPADEDDIPFNKAPGSRPVPGVRGRGSR